MGFLDRVWRVATGLGGALQAPVGLVKDLATAPWTEDDIDGFIPTIYQHTVKRGGQFLGNLAGPEEGLGAIAGGLPEALRAPTRSAIKPIERGLEFAYREGVSQPVSAMFIQAGQEEGGSRFLTGTIPSIARMVTNPDEARRAYALAENVSPGQAAAAIFSGQPLHSEADLAKIAGSDSYEVISGTVDAVYRLFADPTIVGGKAAMALKARTLTTPIRTAADIDRAMSTRRVLRFAERIEGKSAAEIRHAFFPDHAHGAVISTVLAEAPDASTRAMTLRALMGDVDALEGVRGAKASVAGAIDRLAGERDDLLRNADTLFGDPERLARVSAELDELYPQADRAARLDTAFGTIREIPRARRADDLRAAVTRSDFYQSSPFAAPLRVTFNMRPHQLVNLHDQTGDVQLSRMLAKSDLPRESQDALRNEYMAALNPGQRQQVLLKAEADAVRSIAERAGMTASEIEGLLQEGGRRRARASEVLQSRVYDGEGRSKISFEDAEGYHDVHLPLWITQETNVLPVANLDDVRKAAEPIGRFRLRHPGTDIPAELLNGFYRVWRPSVLLRGAWPIRVVGDEQLRIIAKIGALAHLKNEGTTFGAWAKDRVAGVPKGQRGLRGLKVRDYDMQAQFGAPDDAANIYRHLVSSRASFEQMVVGQAEKSALDKMREASGEWRSIRPDESDYARSWEHAVNQQIGYDPMARKFLTGATVDEVVDWLTKDPAGMQYAARNTIRARNPRRWAEMAREQVDSYLPTDELRNLALGRKASADDLVRALPDASSRPIVHGEILAQTLGKSTIARTLNNFVEFGYRNLGSKPSDVLSRNRFFDHMYRAEVTRLVNLLDDQVKAKGGRLDDAMLRKVEGHAREYALRETRDLLYDLAEQSELAEIMRFFMPFYGAWQEVITRWAGLAAENPAFVARMRQVWQSPEKAGLITDEEGNRVGWGDDAKGGRFITLALPEWARDIPGLRTQGSVRFNKESFNMALSGAPGFGPVVQVPVNEVVKDRPDLESSVKFVLPFGTTQETIDLLLPATWRRLKTRVGGEDDRTYFNAMMRIYWDKVVDYNLGKRDDKPTWAEAKKETDAFFAVRTFASYFSPAAPQFSSPYQMHIDAYRRLKAADPENADMRFIDEFGEEFFPLTQSLSKSMDGVPPTIPGWRARKRYQDMIERHPDLGGLIVGAEGAGEFARSVYDNQLQSRLRPGSPFKQRETPSFEEASVAPDVRLGWIEYRQAMDLIDAERIQRGLPNLRVKAAGDLAALKSAITEKLGEKYPAWFESFSVVDRGAMTRRLQGMREIAADDRLAQRPDIQGLRDYLEARHVIGAALSEREFKTLDAVANEDLANLWDTIVGKIVEQNLAFGDLYHRWLSRDQPEAA